VIVWKICDADFLARRHRKSDVLDGFNVGKARGEFLLPT